MKKLLKLTYILLIISAISLCNSCRSAKTIGEKFLTVEKGAIPVDFGKKGTTLLIYFLGNGSEYDKAADQPLSTFYKGEYQLIEGYILFGSKKNRDTFSGDDTTYKDTDKYRFIFVVYADPFDPSVFIKVLDRKEKKTYRSKRESINFRNFAFEYLKKLEKQRVLNAG